jgi:hypothetical protein
MMLFSPLCLLTETKIYNEKDEYIYYKKDLNVIPYYIYNRMVMEHTNKEYLTLKEHYAGSSVSTMSSYRNNYNKMIDALDGLEITEVSENTIIKAINTSGIENPHTRNALLNINIIVRSLPDYQLGVSDLIEKRSSLTTEIFNRTKEKNNNIDLPSYDKLIEFMNEQYDKGNYRGYVINYLLLNYQVRNQDLDFTIVKTRKEMDDKTRNYLWVNVKTKAVIYQRNIYKTAKVYGSLEASIKDAKFMKSIKVISNLQDINKKDNNHGKEGVFIKNVSSLPKIISRYTLDELGEGRYCKVVVNHFRNDPDMINTISLNRGTSLKTLMFSYNIDFTN